MERVGSDRVSAEGERLVVESRADMPGWEVRAFRRAAIVYRGERWFVAAKKREGAGFRYTLEHWDDARADIDGGVIEYDAGYVYARDAAERARAVAGGTRAFVLPFYPLIGLLPSALKRRLADRFGIDEDLTTKQSIVLEAGVGLMCGALISISSMANVYGGAFGVKEIPWLDQLAGGAAPVAVVLIAPDVVMRYARILGESGVHWGFWEWLFRRER